MRTASPDLGCSGECFTVGGLESAANNAVWPIQSATKLPHRSRIAERISTDKRRFKAQGGCGMRRKRRFILAVPGLGDTPLRTMDRHANPLAFWSSAARLQHGECGPSRRNLHLLEDD